MPTFNDSTASAQIDALRKKEEERLVQTLAPKYGYPYVDLHDTPIDQNALRLLDENEARRAEVAVFEEGNRTLSIAVRNPKHPELPEVLKKLEAKGYVSKVFLASLPSLDHAWEKYRDVIRTTAQVRGVLDVDPELIKQFATEIETILDVGGKIAEIQKENSVVKTSKTIGAIFGGALSLGASDIHIEPGATLTRVRYRLDGVLSDVCDIDKEISSHMVSRLKLLSGLKLNVKREAQDGRFTFDIGTRAVEVRSSVIPGGYGESMVMRLLDPDSSAFKIDNLGLSERLREVMDLELKRPNGAVITTGPTGSGKTTALYSFLLAIHTPEIKIITIEDPIEYKLPGIVQTQVSESYSFEAGLRSVLRQDPDAILIGEIRDRDVAETAIHAAQTGHLVFSTLHTNSAAGAIARLSDLGIDGVTIGSAVNIILGQRLVRLLCDQCKVEREITAEENTLFQRVLEKPLAIHTIFDAKGCEHCGGSGYKGRMGVYEAIRIDDQVREVIRLETQEKAIKEGAKHQGIPTMQQDGIMKVLAGLTSLDEVARVLDLYNQG